MKNTLQQVLLFLFISSMSIGLAVAGKPDPNLRKEAHQQVMKEMHAYVNKQVMPVLKDQRRQLDKQMTAADKQKVEQLRQELKKLESQRRQFLKEGLKHRESQMGPRQDGLKQRPVLTDEQKAQLQEQRETRHRIFEEANTIALKYKPQLERIRNEVSSHRNTWEKDMKAIADANAPQTEEGFRHRPPHHFGKRMPFQHLMRPAHFVLWDVKEMPAAGETQTMNSLTVYPNPSTTSTTVNYVVDTAGPVKVTLLDSSGNSVRVLVDQKQQTGAFSEEVNVQHLPNGIYFYRIETADGSQTLRFLKK
ncbi:T9SS type A sorting domain-containing protein [Botryobacter ruber]|uniref:T9SS type A sorting domain-containing protein n=1 Tax=Botryobacter ruber TaxID=2171629 RepID=UPI000E0B318B|nr:T9SS type A sorting domain-containing protein [Botryobacter ruber]